MSRRFILIEMPTLIATAAQSSLDLWHKWTARKPKSMATQSLNKRSTKMEWYLFERHKSDMAQIGTFPAQT